MRAIVLLFLFAGWFMVNVSAQETPTSSYGLAQAGFKAYQEGKYEDAARLLEQLVQKYPTAEETPNGKFLLGLSYYSLGKYAEGVKALENLKGLEAKSQPIADFHLGICLFQTGDFMKVFPLLDKVAKSDNKEMQPYALLYYARAKFEQARQQPAAARQAAADGIAKIDQLVKNFADSDVIPDALMTKANLLIATKDFTQATQALDELKAKPESKEFELDIDYMLGFAYTQQAKTLREEFKPEEAAAAIKLAREVYTRLAANDNLIIANQAAFELANLDFDAAQVAPPDGRAAAYQKAIDTYRSLKSKDDLIASQTQVVQSIRDDIGKSATDKKRVAALTRQLQREQQKLAGLQNGSDQAAAALIRIADCYQRMGRFDETRIVSRAALPIANEDQAAGLNTQIIISYALQGQSQKAEDAYAKFKQEHANDPNAAVVPYFIGIAFTQEKKYEEAIQKFDQILKDYPTSKVAAGVPQAKANAYLAWGRVDEALKSYDDFIKNYSGKVEPEAIDSAKLARGYALATAKKYADAIIAFQDVAANAKNPAVRAEAALCAGNYLNSTGRQEQAIETFKKFIADFPDNPNVPTSAYSIGFAYEGMKKYPEAVAAYQHAIEKYPDDPTNRLKCHERVWRCHLAQNDYDSMVKAQDEQVAAFPGSERNMAAYFERGKYLEDKNKTPEEIAAAYMKVTEAFDALPDILKTGENGQKSAQFPSAALLKLAGLYQREAAKLGNFDALAEDKLAEWKNLINSAYKYTDIALQKYNQYNLPLELQNMNKIQLLRIKAKLTTVEDATTYLSKLAGELSGNKADAAQIMIARAAFVYELDNKTQALNFYKDAFASVSSPTDIGWQDYDRYGSILLDNKNWQDAKQLFGTLMMTYQNDPPNPNQKGTYDRARACATYGLGAVEAGLGNVDQAEEYFKTLKEKYPWSEKLLNADYQRAVAFAGKGQYDEAFKLWKIIMAFNIKDANEIKARSVIAFAQTLMVMGDKGVATEETKEKGKPEANIYDLAARYGLKAYFFYPDESAAPEGLCLAVSAYSQKLNDKANAKKWFEVLSQKYPTSPWTAKAQGML
jgi:tetratricopeptide (TPR) repeat protein